jgi:hypothetical protein
MVLVATLFHRSAFVILAIFPLCHLRITAKWLYAIVPLMLLVYVFNKPIFNMLMLLFGEDSASEGSGAITVLVLLVLFAVYSFVVADESMLEKEVLG